METVQYILDLNILEEEINELKLVVHGDNGRSHRITKEYNEYNEEYVIIELYSEKNYHLSGKDLFFGKVVKDKLYIARHQHIPHLYDEINVYDEFIGEGTELTFN